MFPGHPLDLDVVRDFTSIVLQMISTPGASEAARSGGRMGGMGGFSAGYAPVCQAISTTRSVCDSLCAPIGNLMCTAPRHVLPSLMHGSHLVACRTVVTPGLLQRLHCG